MQYWETTFTHGCKLKLLWREQSGIANKSYLPTRWSHWDSTRQVMDLWGDVPNILANPDTAPKSKEKLQLLLQTKENELLIKEAVNVDVGL